MGTGDPDGWADDTISERRVRLEQVFALDPAAGSVCLAGARNCPPEDCGGIPGYAHFLAAIGNQRHPDHEGMLG